MKIKRNITFRNKLLKLQLLETKAFDKKSYLKLEDIEYKLKNVAHIIHKYNISGKSILFIGVPTKIGVQIKRLINTNKHIFLPTSLWIKGILSNKKLNRVNLSKNAFTDKGKISRLISQIKTKVELVVILDADVSNNILTESYISRKPTIFLNQSLDTKNNCDYIVPIDLEFKNKQSYKNLLYSILVAVLKKRLKVEKLSNKK